jgi:hypothetical protein
LLPGAEDRNCDQHLRDAEHAGDLGIAKSLDEAEGEYFSRALRERADGSRECLAQVCGFRVGAIAGNVDQLQCRIGLARADYIQGRVDCGAAQVALFVIHHVGLRAAQQAQENGLQDVFGVGRVAGEAIRGTEDQAVMRAEGAFEFVGDGYCRILFYQYASQGTPPCSSVSPVKTEGKADYYKGEGHYLGPVLRIGYG